MHVLVGSTQVYCTPQSLLATNGISVATFQAFARKVQITSGCWLWTGAASVGNYGQLRVGKKLRYAHVLSYEMFVGPVPEGLDIDHRCHDPFACHVGRAELCPHRRCVRPTHLKPATRSENCSLVRSNRWDEDKCSGGHPWTTESTYMRKDPKTPTGYSRTCRICWNERARAAYAARRADEPSKPHPNAVKTHCPKDHEYTPENTIVRPNGSRACRECGKLATKAWAKRKRDQTRPVD